MQLTLSIPSDVSPRLCGVNCLSDKTVGLTDAGYYGLSLIVGSLTVLFVSLAAHACQFAFLVWFENPRRYDSSHFFTEL